jgi:hypothetical protein
MDINVVYNTMLEKLRTSNRPDLVTGLEESAAGAATGSEALIDTALYLANLKSTCTSVYELLREEIKQYNEYCRQNGIQIR